MIAAALVGALTGGCGTQVPDAVAVQAPPSADKGTSAPTDDATTEDQTTEDQTTDDATTDDATTEDATTEDQSTDEGSGDATGPNHAEGAALVAGAGNPVVVDYFFDFQCPFCGEFEQAAGSELVALVDEGEVELHLYPMSFLDDMLGNSSSAEAANAAACASDQGMALPFTTALFSRQPPEGDGYTEADLLDSATQAELPDQSRFEECVGSQTYASWVDEVDVIAMQKGVSGTPTLMIDGTTVETPGSGRALRDLVEKAGD